MLKLIDQIMQPLNAEPICSLPPLQTQGYRVKCIMSQASILTEVAKCTVYLLIRYCNSELSNQSTVQPN